jgi:hypothetical protein
LALVRTIGTGSLATNLRLPEGKAKFDGRLGVAGWKLLTISTQREASLPMFTIVR